ncbi:MAG: helicase-associated domain-containing protein [Treponema sp.]|nr:helicase-associated domain-containing protein [Treponema sp.]
MNSSLRSVSFWKSALITMPDNSFYELLRSVFGKIKTPFNKQQLLNNLETFLKREDIQKAISVYIDTTDAKIIAAITLFGEPSLDQLERFFFDDFNLPQLQDIIVNLEERFILYRFAEEKKIRLALNPVLMPALLPFMENTSLLFEYDSEKNAANSYFDDLTFAALYSFICKHESFYRSEGVLRRRIIEEGKSLFPGIDLSNTFGALMILGLFYTEGEQLIPDKKYLNDFTALTLLERKAYFAAAVTIYSQLTPPFEILPPLFRAKIKEIVNLINCIINFYKQGSQPSGKTLRKIAEILKARTYTAVNIDLLLETLEKTGLSGYEAPKIKSENEKETPVIAITGSAVLVYPEIDFNDAIKLASMLNISEKSTVIRFELDKESVIRAFDNNISADEIIELLNKLSNGKTGDSLIWNIKDWEKRHKDVSLKKGVVLQLAEEHRYLIETKPFISLITETLAPGVYLLNDNSLEKTAEALKKAGIDIIGRRKEKNEASAMNGYYFPPLPSAPLIVFDIQETETNSKIINNKNQSAELHTKLHETLEKMTLNETEKSVLTARIARRLVLCKDQLKDADIRYEKLEARHMDYTGKQNIAKHAISQQSPVEVIYKIKGKEKIVYGVPKSLEKDENELLLVIDAEKIPLAKISLLRRIKKSIFEV